MGNTVVTHAPAKLILSGEHAVVYGAPALGMTLDGFTTTARLLKNTSGQIVLKLRDFDSERTLNVDKLKQLKQTMDAQYSAFLPPRMDPQDLLPYVLASYAEHYNILYEGMVIDVHSTIPIGLGLGSSAAAIVSLLRALSIAFIPILPATHFIQFAQKIEDFVHGKSSGFDIALVVADGCLYRYQGTDTSHTAPHFTFMLVSTGLPTVNTAACVQKAAAVFKKNPTLLSEFVETTQACANALKRQKITEIKKIIAKNHQLLCKIGVIPDKIQRCITQIEKRGNAAKICGAGATEGDSAGVLWVVGEYPVSDILEAYGYSLLHA